jgi:RNA polymerase sigma factor (sigma-70 family)
MRLQYQKYFDNCDLSLFYSYAYKITRDKEAMRDIVTDAVVSVYNSQVEFNDEGHFKAYLYNAVRFKALDFTKKQNYNSNKNTSLYTQKDFEDTFSSYTEAETFQEIYSEIETLPDMQQKIIRLTYYGLTIKEIAGSLKISESVVKRHKSRAIKHLRNKLLGNNQIIKEVDKTDNDDFFEDGKTYKLCFRIRDGRIEVIMERSDGMWVLADETMKLINGLYIFKRSNWAILLKELERLINKSNLHEDDLQNFFETHPELVLGDEYESVIPQATIIKDDKKKWRADFVLIPSDQLSFSKILELKLPSEKISLTCKNGHSRYSKKIFNAINQLIDYYQAFDSDRTRQIFMDRYQTEVFKPDLQLVFGRRNSINNDKEFLELQRRNNLIITDWDSLYEKLKKKYS